MVLVTGPAGSGKSTTLACMIDHINSTRHSHIITLEDPLEYLHMHKMSIVSQREVVTDTESYLTALRASLRQSPDVILLGEMRDYETMNVAMTAAETGHLILSTLHTIGASNTIDRIIDAFPPNQQHQIALQLSMVLQAVVSQQLVPSTDGGLVPAFEIMTLTPAIRNMIRESKVHQIDGMIYASAADDMIAMDTSLLNLYKDGKITDTGIEAVISNNANAYALQRAKDAGIKNFCISPKDFKDREAFNEALLSKIDEISPDLIVLAGFLVNIPETMVKSYKNRIINIHPSLIPSFCGKGYYGLKVHEAALSRGVKISGATVHFVDEGTDTGPIILQKAVEVLPDDTPQSLQRRIMEQAEWVILPKAIQMLAHR